MKKVLSIISIFTLLFTCYSVPGRGAGCNTNTKYSFNLSELKRHEFRVFFSDALTLGLSDAFATSLFNALSGTRSDTKSSLMYGIGYRHSLNRFRIGGDLGLYVHNSKLYLNMNNHTSVIDEDIYRLLIIPTGEFIYFNKGILSLYGSAGAGVILSRYDNSEKATTDANFAFQINPIALRLGNETIGAFLEGGWGFKGYITIGIGLKF